MAGKDAQVFFAPVVYVQPEFNELWRRFPGCLNPTYERARFYPIERCKDVSTESREVTFVYVYMDRGRHTSTNEVLAEMDSRDLRPALYEELLGFADKYPDEQQKYPIVALGSVAYSGSYYCAACLWHNSGSRFLYLYTIYDDWNPHNRFLAVPKR